MTVAYVMEQNASVTREGGRILIKKDRTILHTLHAFKLEQIVLFGNVFLTPAAISHLLKLGIDTVFMSKNGRYKGRLQGPHGKNISLRQQQFTRMGNPEFCLYTARYIVGGKLNNLRSVLLRLNRSRKGIDLDDQILGLKTLNQKVEDASDLDVLRGLEGRGAVLYFQGFSKGFLADGIEFKKRIRRPPTDPVNALLSLGYTFLFNEVMGAVSMIGFDPYLGSLHAVEYGRPSLPLDLMEEWRPVIVDSLVLSLFNLKILTQEDFIVSKESDEILEEGASNNFVQKDSRSDKDSDRSPRILPVKLTDDGMRKFITQFERKMTQKTKYHLTDQQLSYRDSIREQVRHFARYLRGEESAYQPIALR